MTHHLPNVHALLFGLSEDLAGELIAPLKSCVLNIETVHGDRLAKMRTVFDSAANVIFCGPDVSVVSELRSAKPKASIVVVSRHPEVSVWLDSIEAGATDYCAAPFETSQVRWILESSLLVTSASAAAA